MARRISLAAAARLRSCAALPGIVAVTLTAYASSGCVANHYRIDRAELERLITLPPPTRGAGVRVVQALGSDREPGQYYRPLPPPAPPPAPALTPYAPPSEDDAAQAGVAPPPGQPPGPPPGPPPEIVGPAPGPPVQSSGHVGVGVHLDVPLLVLRGPGPRGTGREMIRRSPTRIGSSRPSGWGGAAGQLRSDAGSGGGELMIVVAVVLIAVAVFAVAGLAVSEGLRYDGEVALAPYQPIHLENSEGHERVVSLWDLQPGDLDQAVSAIVIERESKSDPERIQRAPLNRRGVAFKVDIGGLSSVLDDWTITGVASNIQIGYFFHQRFGLLGNLSLGLASDQFDRPLARHSFGIEAQAFPIDFGRLHLGAYLGGGQLIGTDNKGNFVMGPSFGGGGIVELALTTRLAFMVRGGWTFAGPMGYSWLRTGAVTAGLAIY